MKTHLLLFVVISCLITFNGCKDDDSEASSEFDQYREFTISAGDPEIQFGGRVFLPLAYQENKNLPVIYIMEFESTIHPDVQQFEKIISITTSLGIEAIVVAGEKFDENSNNFNNFEKFHGIMVNDLVPVIDSRYENNNQSRTLIGRGNGAAHALLTMLMETPVNTTFNKFIVTDPPSQLGYILNTMISDDDFPQDKKAIKLHLSSTQSAQWMDPLSEILENKNYPWLTFSYEAFPNALYDNSAEDVFLSGISYLF
jgi:hypothetical protein